MADFFVCGLLPRSFVLMEPIEAVHEAWLYSVGFESFSRKWWLSVFANFVIG
jgi:hypothetical protein